MDSIEVGQELEFIEAAHAGEHVIEKGTHVRVGFIESDVLEPNIMVVVLGTSPPQTLMVPRHVLTLHCRSLHKPA